MVEKLGVELQAAIARIMTGPGTPEEKTREATRLSQAFQARIRQIHP